MRLPSLLALTTVLGAPAVPMAMAQAMGIEHQPVSCLVAGKFPRMAACVPEPDGVGKARVYFRAEGTSAWYHVIMGRDAACFAAALPKPRRELLGRHVEYYVEADHRRLGSPRTPEYRALVVPTEGACTGFVAKLAKAAPSAVFPALPAGFAAGGASLGTAAIVGAGAAAAGGTAVAVGAAGGGEEEVPPPTTAPATEPTASTTRPTSSTQPGAVALALECAATPDSGPLPLTVRFDAGATGVSVSPSFVWDFGDGTSAPGSAVQHVYSAAGRFTATVTGTAGNATGTCARQIAAAVAPVATGTLSVKVGGTGSGVVSSSPAGIECRAACSAPFAQGSEVVLRASAQPGSKFTAWGGDCSGTDECRVKMNGNPSVDATFERVVISTPETFQLTVTRQGAGNSVVRSSPAGVDCGGDCTERYASGTQVSLNVVSSSVPDFKEWGGECSGSGACSVVMDRDRSVTASFSGASTPTTTTPTTTTTTTTTTMAPAPAALTVQLVGAGTGTVTGAGINCPGTCSAGQTAGSTVTIHAQAGGSSVFSGWSGDCAGQSDNCTLTMSGARTARARFDALFRLDVSIQGTGRVRSDSVINCPPTCTETRVDGAVVTLVAQVIAGGGAFQGWSGACAQLGTEQSCEVKMDRNQSVGARFDGIVTPLRPAASAWRSVLDAPGARGTVAAGTLSFAAGPGERIFELPGSEETVVTAVVEGAHGGTWRFEAQDADAVEPGSLRVIAGEALSVGTSSIAFRLGREARLAFAFRTRGRP
ncbi:MAG: PKD domain-containing protein [Vicinamibacteria bacterium]